MAFELQCPSCSAPVTVKNKASLFVVCPSCGTSSRRSDQNLEEYGKTAELQDDNSPFQLRTTCKFDGKPFEFIGRIQYQLPTGFWNEWYMQTPSGDGAWLSEAQGFLVVSREEAADGLPTFDQVSPGASLNVAGTEMEVKEVQNAEVISGEGELPFAFEGGFEAPVVDLVDEDGNFATIDYSDETPRLFKGRNVKYEEMSFGNLKDAEAAKYYTAKTKASQVACSGCGAKLALRGGSFSKSLVCEFCGSVMDATHPEHKVIAKIKQAVENAPKPLVELGSKASFPLGRLAEKGEDKKALKEYELVGFMQRFVTYANVDYPWREYLWLSTEGDGTYLWLLESDGHFNLIRSLNKKVSKKGRKAKFKGDTYDKFSSSNAQVNYVIGEFYWQVSVKGKAKLADYINPPMILSSEETGNEIVWALGEYIEPATVAGWLNIDKGSLPSRSGIHPAQPNPWMGISKWLKRFFWGFTAALLGVVIFYNARSLNKKVLSFSQNYNRMHVATAGQYANYRAPGPDYGTDRTKRPVVSNMFYLERDRRNLVVDIKVPSLSNNWAFFNMLLVPMPNGKGQCNGPAVSTAGGGKKKAKQKVQAAKGTAKSIAFAKEVSYYYGSDWSEGSRDENFSVPTVKKGCYYLWVDPLFDPRMRTASWRIQLTHDSPSDAGAIFMWLLVLMVPRVVAFFRRKSFEGKRWSESDYGD